MFYWFHYFMARATSQPFGPGLAPCPAIVGNLWVCQIAGLCVNLSRETNDDFTAEPNGFDGGKGLKSLATWCDNGFLVGRIAPSLLRYNFPIWRRVG